MLAKLNVPSEEMMTFTKQIKERRMGELFKHFKAYDVQAARKQMREELIQEIHEEVTQKVREEVTQEVREEVTQEVREQVAAEIQDENIKKLIQFGKKYGISIENILVDLKEQYFMEEAQAKEKIELYW